MKDKTAIFRYGSHEEKAIKSIIEYLQDKTPGLTYNVSDAVRFALITKAQDIRKEQAAEL